jgi:hypothetical protein
MSVPHDPIATRTAAPRHRARSDEEQRAHSRRGRCGTASVGAQDRQAQTGLLRTGHGPSVLRHQYFWLHDPKAHGKVLNIEWIDKRVELRAFKRGDWERELEAHARRRMQ